MFRSSRGSFLARFEIIWTKKTEQNHMQFIEDDTDIRVQTILILIYIGRYVLFLQQPLKCGYQTPQNIFQKTLLSKITSAN